MTDVFVKNPVLLVGEKDKVVAQMGENDFGVATDVEFYTKQEVDDLVAQSGGTSLPDQTGNAGKVLRTNGTDAEWTDDYVPSSGGTFTGTLLLAKTGRYALESMGEMKITNSDTGAFTYLNGGNIQVGPAKIIGVGTSTSNPTLQIGLGTINSYYQFTKTGFFATRTESKILGSKTSPWEVVYAKTISVGGSDYDIAVPQKTGTIALVEDIDAVVGDISTALTAILGE